MDHSRRRLVLDVPQILKNSRLISAAIGRSKMSALQMLRKRRTIVILVLSGVVIAGLCYFNHRLATQTAQREAQFLARFQNSFQSGATELIGAPQVTAINRLIMSEYGYGSLRAPGVSEYVVTAIVKRGDKEVWGRWLYTCTSGDLDAIYKYSYSEADKVDALPRFPFPMQSYIPWTMGLIDGIPLTAGPSASKISVSSPLNVADDLVISASAPPGTTCRIEVYPKGALVSDAPPQKPGTSGLVQWKCRINPNFKGGQVGAKVYCAIPIGSMILENEMSAPLIEVLP
jgi:hypothetical protein